MSSAGRNKITAADLVQDEKHTLGLRAARADTEGDFDSARAYRYAMKCLESVETRLRAAAEPEAKQGAGETCPPDCHCFVYGSKARAAEPEAKACALVVDLGHVPKMNEDEAQCMQCGRVRSEASLRDGVCAGCLPIGAP